MGRTGTFIYQITDWIMRLAIANALWILFTTLGGIVLGAYPASVACTALLREWIHGERPKPFRFFLVVYKQSFWKANAVFFPGMALAAALLLNVYSSLHFNGFWFYLFVSSTAVFLIALSFLLLLALIPLAENESWKISLQRALNQLLLHPGRMFLIVLGTIIIGTCIRLLPGLLPLYSINIILLLMVCLFYMNDNQDTASTPF
ncbi:DUF624 domain-containing protein [Salibacterium salarium]|uniref:DUF624 domain-containing protein n=1 Tax=Salibacterium salarium TaxID=284579 RepID=A0A428N6M1_9BACI|nr:DUF624 domain-containing protein [Salibacterium salarium]RSL33899.1 DUF624 domain-containing protein [Salibacterium salarium]